VDKKSWEHRLVNIIENALSYNPPQDTPVEELTKIADNFGKQVIEHIDLEVIGLNRVEKGTFLVKLFATFFLRAREAQQPDLEN
jgi:hypothetical protein